MQSTDKDVSILVARDTVGKKRAFPMAVVCSTVTSPRFGQPATCSKEHEPTMMLPLGPSCYHGLVGHTTTPVLRQSQDPSPPPQVSVSISRCKPWRAKWSSQRAQTAVRQRLLRLFTVSRAGHRTARTRNGSCVDKGLRGVIDKDRQTDRQKGLNRGGTSQYVRIPVRDAAVQ